MAELYAFSPSTNCIINKNDRYFKILLEQEKNTNNIDEKTAQENITKEKLEAFKLKSTTLYVGNLSFYTTEEQIYELFSKCGEIKKIIMGLNKFTKTPCGFCFVEYCTPQSAQNCMKYINQTKLDDRIIRTELDPGFTEGRQFGRGKTGGQVRDEFRADYDPGRIIPSKPSETNESNPPQNINQPPLTPQNQPQYPHQSRQSHDPPYHYISQSQSYNPNSGYQNYPSSSGYYPDNNNNPYRGEQGYKDHPYESSRKRPYPVDQGPYFQKRQRREDRNPRFRERREEDDEDEGMS